MPWEAPRARNLSLLEALTRAYGACAMVAWEGERVVDVLTFRAVELPPMRVAFRRALGADSEAVAWGEVLAWTQRNGLLRPDRPPRLFGYDSRGPMAGATTPALAAARARWKALKAAGHELADDGVSTRTWTRRP